MCGFQWVKFEVLASSVDDASLLSRYLKVVGWQLRVFIKTVLMRFLTIKGNASNFALNYNSALLIKSYEF